MPQQFINNFRTVLTAGCTDSATQIQINTTEAAKLASATPTNFYKITLAKDGGGQVEVVKVIGRTGAILTVERGSEDINGAATPTYAWVTGDLVEARITAQSMQDALTGGGSGATQLSELSDVASPLSPTDGQALVYNDTSGEWEPGTAGGGGAGFDPDTILTADGQVLVGSDGNVLVQE